MCLRVNQEFAVIIYLLSTASHMLPRQHVLQVCHNIGNHSPQCRAEVHVMRVLNTHGVTLTMVEPEVSTVCHMKAGTWMRDRKKDKRHLLYTKWHKKITCWKVELFHVITLKEPSSVYLSDPFLWKGSDSCHFFKWRVSPVWSKQATDTKKYYFTLWHLFV